MKTEAPIRNPAATRRRLIEAGVALILRQGFHATTVDQVCAEAALTKGSFFHHFENKEALGRAIISAWSAYGTALYEKAWNGTETDPLVQVHAMIDIMIGFTQRDEPCVCVIGMIAQELSGTSAVLREDCGRELGVWTTNVARLLEGAKMRHPPAQDFDALEVAWFLNSLWQGSMLVAKTQPDSTLIRDNLRLAHDYLDRLFPPTNPLKRKVAKKRKGQA